MNTKTELDERFEYPSNAAFTRWVNTMIISAMILGAVVCYTAAWIFVQVAKWIQEQP